MKLEGVQKIAIIKIDLDDLSEYHKVLSNLIEQSNGRDWNENGMEVLEKLRDQIFAILNDVGDY